VAELRRPREHQQPHLAIHGAASRPARSGARATATRRSRATGAAARTSPGVGARYSARARSSALARGRHPSRRNAARSTRRRTRGIASGSLRVAARPAARQTHCAEGQTKQQAPTNASTRERRSAPSSKQRAPPRALAEQGKLPATSARRVRLPREASDVSDGTQARIAHGKRPPSRRWRELATRVDALAAARCGTARGGPRKFEPRHALRATARVSDRCSRAWAQFSVVARGTGLALATRAVLVIYGSGRSGDRLWSGSRHQPLWHTAPQTFIDSHSSRLRSAPSDTKQYALRFRCTNRPREIDAPS
jgi:hypothetical protein